MNEGLGELRVSQTLFYNKRIEIMHILKKVYKSIKIGWILLTGKQKV